MDANNIMKTKVSINGDRFKINEKFINKDRQWKGIEIQGLLFNSRMVQGIFDDKNPDTVTRWAYPDTGKWDAGRNCKEFKEAMPLWKSKGLSAFTINLQGGSPEGYSKSHPWHNSAFMKDGSLDPAYMARLKSIINRADQLGMIIILGLFYFGQDYRLESENAVVKGVEHTVKWLHDMNYANVLIEINNECNIRYSHNILKPDRVHELIELVRSMDDGHHKLMTSASYGGGSIPADNVIGVSDYILLHGNGVRDPLKIEEMVKTVRRSESYRGQPIVFNEDDHFDFDKDINNLVMAIRNGASWGYFDPGISNYEDGYQCPPVNWGINTSRKKAFFDLLQDITGS